VTKLRYEVLDQFAPVVRAPEPDLDGLLRRRDRRRQTQRITAAVVALAVCAATVLVVVTSHPSEP
jgi:putative NIF3 family GTP cyclohydrolase 1 type 2